MLVAILLLLKSWVIFEVFTYYQYKKNKRLPSKIYTYQRITDDIIRKFKRFDNYLGWDNKPNMKIKGADGLNIQYTYGKLGERITTNQSEESHITISTYGDSFCQCDEVNDDQTWQSYLAKESGYKLLNFGVGAYGLDQSILKIKRNYDKNPTDIVILEMAPYTIRRVVSTYYAFNIKDQIINCKPRFIINKKNKLELIPHFLERKEELENISKYDSFFKKNDDIYIKLKNIAYTFPYIIKALTYKNIYKLKVLYPTLVRLARKTKLKKLEETIIKKIKLLEYKEYENIYIKNSNLINGMLNEFLSFSKEKNFIPIVLLIPTSIEIKYFHLFKETFYDKLINDNSKKIKILNWSILMSKDYKNNSLEDWYTRNGTGHCTPYHNMQIAKFLHKELIFLLTKH